MDYHPRCKTARSEWINTSSRQSPTTMQAVYLPGNSHREALAVVAGFLIGVLDALPGFFMKDGLKGIQVVLSILEA